MTVVWVRFHCPLGWWEQASCQHLGPSVPFPFPLCPNGATQLPPTRAGKRRSCPALPGGGGGGRVTERKKPPGTLWQVTSQKPGAVRVGPRMGISDKPTPSAQIIFFKLTEFYIYLNSFPMVFLPLKSPSLPRTLEILLLTGSDAWITRSLLKSEVP